MFRCESKYLREWIEYHKLIGFEYFYFFDNNIDHGECRKSYEIIANSLVGWRFEYFNWYNTQLDMYQYLIENCPHTWLALIDTDEFIFCESSLQDFLYTYDSPEIASLYLHWKCFGSSGREHDGLLTIDLWRRAELNYWKNLNCKSIIRPKRCSTQCNAHTIKPAGSRFVVNVDFVPFPSNIIKPTTIVHNKACIHHYPIRSEENLLMKQNRGYKEFDVDIDYLQKYRELYDHNEVEDMSMAPIVEELAFI